MTPMGKCIYCTAPIFCDEPVEGEPCLDCIFDGITSKDEWFKRAHKILDNSTETFPPTPETLQ